MKHPGLCKHAFCEGLKHCCELGHDPAAMAKAAATGETPYRIGLAFRLPCKTRDFWEKFDKGASEERKRQVAEFLDQRAECADFEEPTAEEVKAYVEETNRMIARLEKVFPLISKLKKEHDERWSGVEKCPVCGKDLHITVTPFVSVRGPEKHTFGYCETPECVSWRE